LKISCWERTVFFSPSDIQRKKDNGLFLFSTVYSFDTSCGNTVAACRQGG